MPDQDLEQRFLAAMREWLVTLPHDLKILYEAASDENLPRSSRELAVGAIMYTVSPDHLPGVPREDFQNYVDRTIVLHLALHRIAADGGDDGAAFRDRFAEFYRDLDTELALCKQALGDGYTWVRTKADSLTTSQFKGKKVAVYLDDAEASEFLYEEGLEFQTEYDVDDEILEDRLKRASTVFDALEKRIQADTRAH